MAAPKRLLEQYRELPSWHATLLGTMTPGSVLHASFCNTETRAYIIDIRNHGVTILRPSSVEWRTESVGGVWRVGTGI